jgi:hypothetical protein
VSPHRGRMVTRPTRQQVKVYWCTAEAATYVSTKSRVNPHLSEDRCAACPKVRREPFCPANPTFRRSPRSARAGGYVVRLVFRGVADCSACLPSPRGLWCGVPHLLRSRLRSRAANGFASFAPFHGGHPRGECPRSIPRRLASPLPSSTFRCPAFRRDTVVHEVPTTGVRRIRRYAGATLLTLTPTLPSRPDPCGPTFRPDCLSWGCPKIAPPSFAIEESDARDCSLRGWTASPSRVPPAWFCTTSTDLPLRPCRSVSPCCRSWGSLCFGPSRNGLPPSAFLPFEVFPPPTATDPVRDRVRGPASPRALPPRPSPQAPCRWFPTARPPRSLAAVPGAGASRPCSIVGSVASAAICRLRRPDTPLGLADSAVVAPPRLLPPSRGGWDCACTCLRNQHERQRSLREAVMMDRYIHKSLKLVYRGEYWASFLFLEQK